MTANESITHAEPTGHDEAVEVIARAGYERYDSHFSMPGGMTWEQYVADDPTGADAMYREDAREIVAALSSAGLLATEPEWGVRPLGGFDPIAFRSKREAFMASDPIDALVVSRRVTAWTEVDA